MVFEKVTIAVLLQHATIATSFYDALLICLPDENADGIPFPIRLDHNIVGAVAELSDRWGFELPVQLLYDVATKIHVSNNTNPMQIKKRPITGTLWEDISILI